MVPHASASHCLLLWNVSNLLPSHCFCAVFRYQSEAVFWDSWLDCRDAGSHPRNTTPCSVGRHKLQWTASRHTLGSSASSFGGGTPYKPCSGTPYSQDSGYAVARSSVMSPHMTFPPRKWKLFWIRIETPCTMLGRHFWGLNKKNNNINEVMA